MLMVGFNRRFAPHVQQIKALLAGDTGPKSFVMTVNAGASRARSLDAGPRDRRRPHRRRGLPLRRPAALPGREPDRRRTGRIGWTTRPATRVTLHLTLRRRIDRHRPLLCQRLQGVPEGAPRGVRRRPRAAARQLQEAQRLWLAAVFADRALWRQDKGQQACAAAFLTAVRSGGPSPIPFEEIVEVSRTAIALA